MIWLAAFQLKRDGIRGAASQPFAIVMHHTSHAERREGKGRSEKTSVY